MAPPSFRDTLPVITKIGRWFQKQGYRIDSPLFKLHHQVTSLILVIGWCFISFETFLDQKSIVCHKENMNAYAKQYCWIHGYSFIAKEFRGM